MRFLTVDYFLHISRLSKKILAVLVDIVTLIFVIISAMVLRLENFDFFESREIWILLILTVPVGIISLFMFGFYKNIIRYVSKDTLRIIILGILTSTLVMLFIVNFLTLSIPRSVPIIYFSLSVISLGTIRFLLQRIFNKNKNEVLKKVIIYGAGSSGRQLLTTLQQDPNYDTVAFIDDDSDLQNGYILGVPVHSPSNLNMLKSKYNISTVLLAIPSAKISIRRRILEELEKYSFSIRTIPGIDDLISGKATVNELLPIDVLDLLGRDTVSPKNDLLIKNIKNKVVFITGAGGSIGSELCKQIIKQEPKTLILLDLSEFALYTIDGEIKTIIKASNLSLNYISLLGSVTDIKKINDIIEQYNPDTIYHAAAYKHVPLLEENVIEGIKNNVFGTLNLALLASKNNVANFILISTDKAVRPTNVMGATKRLAELICQALEKEDSNTNYTIVRFGNVLASSGSVIPHFDKQIKSGGPVTVTHPEITRYFMTIPEAAELVIQAGALDENTDVFILDMGEPVKILDLAHRMINLQGLIPYVFSEHSDKHPEGDIEIIFSGLRPGEKLYEELVIDDKISTTQHPRIMSAEEFSLTKAELDLILTQLKLCCGNYDIDTAFKILRSTPINYKPKSLNK